MSRHGLHEDDGDNPLEHGRWRGAVMSAIRGKRGQAFLRELADALDAMPVKELVAGELQDDDGCHCALGVIGQRRGLDMAGMDVDDYDALADALKVNAKIAQEIMWENDETFCDWEYVDVVICGPMPPYHFFPYGHKRHERSVRVTRPDAAHQRWKHMRAWVAKQLATTSTSQENQHG